MSRDLNDTRQNRRLEQISKLTDAGDDEALAAVMRTEDGRRVLTRLARDFGWMGETWDATSARQTDFNAGLQSAARKLMGWAERIAAADFLTAIGEATRRDVEAGELAKAATIKEQDDG
ncbi:hypothetical protein [Reyranella sp.]|uniref:Bbp19 family protein n=1 Tax=Reyranella sp. TaxID=1929291 RepID=UPI003D11D5D4